MLWYKFCCENAVLFIHIELADMFRKAEGMLARKKALFLLVIALCAPVASAQSVLTLEDAVNQSIVSNREVQPRWNAFLASQNEQDVALFERLAFMARRQR